MITAEVMLRFVKGDTGHSAKNVMSTGDRLYSYSVLIGLRVGGAVKVLGCKPPSVTTARHLQTLRMMAESQNVRVYSAQGELK